MPSIIARHLHFILLIALLLGSSIPGHAITLRADQPHVDLATDIALLEDPRGTLTFDDLSRPEVSARFLPWNAANGEVNLGFTQSTWWVRIRLQRAADAPESWILDVPYAYNKRLDFQAPRQPLVMTGHDRPVGNQPIFSRHFAFPVKVSEDAQDYYFRAASTYSLSLPLLAWQVSAYVEHTSQMLLLESLYYGGLLALVIYNAFLWRSLRDPRFGHYALFGLFLNAGMFTANGLGRVFLWPEWPAFDEVSSGCLFSLAGVFFLAFARGFLRTKNTWPAIDRIARALMAVYLSFAVLFLLAINHAPAVSLLFKTQLVLSPLTLLFVMLALTRERIHEQPGVSYFILGWSCLAVGSAVATFRAFKWLPTNAWTSYSGQIGSSLEVVLFSFALAAVVRHERQQRIEAQAEMLLSKEKIILLMKDEENRLETAVAARTRELDAALKREHGTLAQYLRFAALVSHEFRNGLNVISSQSDLLRKELASPIIQKRTEVIKQGIDRLATLTNKWLEGDRLLNTEIHASVAAIPLPAWLKTFLQTSGQYSETHPITLELSADAEIIHADPEFLEIVLNNLLDNACKYSPAGSPIVLRSLHRDEMTGIAVEDQGEGIPVDAHADIFEPYYRLTPESRISGSGLGLNFVRRVTEVHGGQATLESTPGHGSVFTVWFPDLKNE